LVLLRLLEQYAFCVPYLLGPFNGLGFLLACFQYLLFVIPKTNYVKQKIQEEIRVFFSKTNAQPFLLKSLQDKASYLLKEKRSMLFVPLKKPRRF